jgi:hypothetical protein
LRGGGDRKWTSCMAANNMGGVLGSKLREVRYGGGGGAPGGVDLLCWRQSLR